MWNKHTFLKEIEEDLLTYLEDNPSDHFEEVEEGLLMVIEQEIEREIIYYYNCWQIVGELRLWSWEDSDYPITDITTLAEKGLHDLINYEICVQEIYTEWLEDGGCVVE